MRAPSSASANSRATARTAFCSGVSSTSIALHGRPDVRVHEAHDVLGRGAGAEELLDADLLPPIVAVEPGLGHHDTDRSHAHRFTSCAARRAVNSLPARRGSFLLPR